MIEQLTSLYSLVALKETTNGGWKLRDCPRALTPHSDYEVEARRKQRLANIGLEPSEFFVSNRLAEIHKQLAIELGREKKPSESDINNNARILAVFFPELRGAISRGELLNEMSPEVYARERVVWLAKSSLWDIIMRLPERMWPNLDLSPYWNWDGGTLFELAACYIGLGRQPAADPRLIHEANVLLTLVRPAVIVDLTQESQERRKQREKLAEEFKAALRGAFPYWHHLEFQYGMDRDGKLTYWSIRSSPEEQRDYYQQLVRTGKNVGKSAKGKISRRIGNFIYWDMFRWGLNSWCAIEGPDLKSAGSSVLKLLRGRPSLPDSLRVRLIVPSREQVPALIGELKAKMDNKWVFREDPNKSPNPASRLAENSPKKHFAYPKNHPRLWPIEIQFDWLLTNKDRWFDSAIDPEGWIFKYISSLSNAEIADAQYRARQIMEVCPWLFPEEIYGINWRNPNIANEIANHISQHPLFSPQNQMSLL